MLMSRKWIRVGLLATAMGIVGVTLAICAEPTTEPAAEPVAPAPAAPVPAATDKKAAATEIPRVTVAAARERATLMHQVYEATLDVMHQRYFHEDRSMVPARAMEDIFKELTRQTDMKARWISVNTEPMSLRHAPENDFERAAAKALSAGDPGYERVENGIYHRAGPIPLAAGCIGCHSGIFAAQAKAPKFAGLVISIPVNEE